MSDSASQDRYAVIGFPIGHSWSPFIHGLFAKQTNQNIAYARIEAAAENFEREVAAFFQTGGKGLNVTVPHKQVAAFVARYRTPRAEIAGAVNTLIAQHDGVHGDNTDGAGLLTHGGACAGTARSGHPGELLLVGSDAKHRIQHGHSGLGNW